MESIVVDIHCHPTMKNYLFNKSIMFDKKTSNDLVICGLQTSLPNLKRGDVHGILAYHYLPEKEFINHALQLHSLFLRFKLFPWNNLTDLIEDNSTPKRPFEQLLEMIEKFEDMISLASQTEKIGIAYSLDEFESGLKDGKYMIIQCIEGAHMLGKGYPNVSDYVEAIKELAQKGIAVITLAHLYPNDVTYCLEGIAPKTKLLLGIVTKIKDLDKGLTDAGKAVVEAMLTEGIIIDLNHATPKARKEIYEINGLDNPRRPLIFSHNSALGMMTVNLDDAWRNMAPTDDEIRYIKKTDGLIGIIFMNFWLNGKEEGDGNRWIPGISLVIETIQYIAKVCSDDGGITLNYNHVAFGSDFDGFSDPCNDIVNPSHIPSLIIEMLKAGISDDNVKLITHLNIKRVLEKGWGNKVKTIQNITNPSII